MLDYHKNVSNHVKIMLFKFYQNRYFFLNNMCTYPILCLNVLIKINVCNSFSIEMTQQQRNNPIQIKL
jgi:hypothetical protein